MSCRRRLASDLPVWHKAGVVLLPTARQLSKSRRIENFGNGGIDAIPEFRKRVRCASRFTRPLVAAVVRASFDKSQHLSHGERVGVPGQQIAPVGAATGFDKSALFEAGEDEFEKLLGNGLTLGDIGDFDRLTGWLGR